MNVQIVPAKLFDHLCFGNNLRRSQSNASQNAASNVDGEIPSQRIGYPIAHDWFAGVLLLSYIFRFSEFLKHILTGAFPDYQIVIDGGLPRSRGLTDQG